MDFGIGLNILEAIYKAVKQLKEVGYNSEQVQRLHFQLTYMIEIITGMENVSISKKMMEVLHSANEHTIDIAVYLTDIAKAKKFKHFFKVADFFNFFTGVFCFYTLWCQICTRGNVERVCYFKLQELESSLLNSYDCLHQGGLPHLSGQKYQPFN